MTEIILRASGAGVSAVPDGPLTSGMSGIKVHVYLDSAWYGIAPKLVCSNGAAAIPMAIGADMTATVPPELMAKGKELRLGLDGWSDDGTLRIPTIWASCGLVRESTNDVDLTPYEPEVTPNMYAQIEGIAMRAERIAQSVRNDADAGMFDYILTDEDRDEIIASVSQYVDSRLGVIEDGYY